MLSFLLFFSLAPPQAPAPKAAVAPIVWSANRPLTIADFKAKAPANPLAALTVADIKAGAACKDFVFSATVEATFDPTQSWFKDPAHATPALLRHEQLHFDITELAARRLRQKLSQIPFDCMKLQPKFDQTTKVAYAEWGREEDRYDHETNHGLNAVRQAYWEKEVREKLAALQAFALK